MFFIIVINQNHILHINSMHCFLWNYRKDARIICGYTHKGAQGKYSHIVETFTSSFRKRSTIIVTGGDKVFKAERLWKSYVICVDEAD